MNDLPAIDEEELQKDKEENFRQRLAFIDWYVAWIKRAPNKEWSRQQKDLIG